MFTFNPEMATTDAFDEGDDAFDTTNLPKEEGEDGENDPASMVRHILVALALFHSWFEYANDHENAYVLLCSTVSWPWRNWPLRPL